MKKLRGAVVGYGFIMDKGHAAGYRQRTDVEVVAIADVSAERRATAAAAWPAARIYADHATLLAAEAANLDFVDIATPPSDHAAITHAALDVGLHVLCEKPLAATIDEARAMLRHASRAERVIYPCHNYKHAPVIKAVRGVIESGRIGKVHLVTLQTFRDTHAKGVPAWRTDWRRERRYSGGGIAMDHGSHTFYLAFEWLRAYPTAITARAVAMGPYDTEDDFSCSLRFPTGTASAHLSWNAGVRKVMYTVHGERGAIRVEDDDIEVAVRERTPGTGGEPGTTSWRFEREAISSDWMDSSHVTWFNSLFDDFKGAIERKEFVGREAEEAFLCVQLISTAYASARDGSRELPLAGLAALAGDDVSDRMAMSKGACPVFDLYIAIANIVFFFGLGGAYLLRSVIVGRRRHARTDADGGSVFLNKGTMEMVYWLLEPIIDFLAALRITPNMVTLFSLLPAAGAGVAIACGWFGLASVLAVMAAFCDIIDGLLARKTGVSSGAGEVIDAAVDRYGEFFLLGGLVYYYRSHDQVLFIVLAAIVGGFMVSYSTAKAEAMGVTAPRGAMRRGERGAYLIFGAAFTPVAKAVFANSASLALHESPIILALSIVAVVSNFSVVQRLGAVIEALRAKEKTPAAPAPDSGEPIGSKPDASAGQV